MANYANLLATIAANIYTNNNNEVTASMVKTAVDAMVGSLGDGYQFMGIATPATNPGTPDMKVCYAAIQPGTYANFGGLVVNGLCFLKGSGSSWTIDRQYVPATGVDSAVTPGVYFMQNTGSTSPSILLVRALSASSVQQGRISYNPARNRYEIGNRTSADGGVTWSAWTSDWDDISAIAFDGTFPNQAALDTLTTDGLYRGATTICGVRRIDANTIWQWWIATFLADGFKILFRISEDNGTTWSAWDDALENGFEYVVTSSAQLNTLVESGVFKAAGVVGAVRRIDASNVWQWRVSTYLEDMDGTPRLEYRTTSDNGTTWSAWTNVLSGIYSNGLIRPSGDLRSVTNPEVVPINDCNFHAAGENHVWIDDASGIMYVVYCTGRSTYYETADVLQLAVVPLAQPWRTEWIDVVTKGDPDGFGGTFDNLATINMCPIPGGLRFFIAAYNKQYYYYKDFDIASKTFGAWNRIEYSGNPLTYFDLESWLVAAGHSPGQKLYIRATGTMYGNPDGGYMYTMLTCQENGHEYHVIVRSDDNFASVEYVGVFPYEVRFDTCIDFYDGKFYILYRRGSDTGLATGDGVYLTTTEDFVTYTTPDLVGTMDMRPDIFVEGGYVNLVVGDKRNSGVGFYRTNAHILRGVGDTLADYVKRFDVTDNRGVVNPKARFWGTDAQFVFSDSPIRLDYMNGYTGQYQGKECVVYYRMRGKY